MMLFTFRWFFMLLMLIIMCPILSFSQELIINRDSTARHSDPIVFQSTKNIFVGYFGFDEKKQESVYVVKLNKSGEIVNSISLKIPDLKPLDVSFSESGNNLILFLISKSGTGQKYVHRFISIDGGNTFSEPLLINRGTGALSPMRSAVSLGYVYIAWIDERSNKKHDIYMNISGDNGETFEEYDINLTDSFEGVGSFDLVVEGQKAHIFFKASDYNNNGLFYRNTIDGGRTWSTPVLITKFEPFWQPHELKTMKIDDKSIGVSWIGRGLYLAKSDDGVIWKLNSIIPSDDTDYYIWKHDVVTKNGKIIIVYDRGLVDYKYLRKKPSVFYVKSDDRGVTWSNPESIRRYQYDTTSARIPSIASLINKPHVLAVWCDFRNIRGGIFYNYSTDGGDTWSYKDFSLEDEPERYNNLVRKVISIDSFFYVLWLRYKDDRKELFDIYIKKLNIEDLKGKR